MPLLTRPLSYQPPNLPSFDEKGRDLKEIVVKQEEELQKKEDQSKIYADLLEQLEEAEGQKSEALEKASAIEKEMKEMAFKEQQQFSFLLLF